MTPKRGWLPKRSKDRAAVVLLDGENVCLIERNREGRIYYLFPGGGVDPGETFEQAAVREAKEELGLDVKLDRLVADLAFKGARQKFFLAHVVGGEFGTGTGEELSSAPDSTRGSYMPLWIPLRAAVQRDSRPKELIRGLMIGDLAAGRVLRTARR
ncbi:MAG: NUDIX domain-containing protein [Trueperaceae bacterium]